MPVSVFFKDASSGTWLDLSTVTWGLNDIPYVTQILLDMDLSLIWNDPSLICRKAQELTNRVYKYEMHNPIFVGVNHIDMKVVRLLEEKDFKSDLRLHQWYPGMIRLNPSLWTLLYRIGCRLFGSNSITNFC